MSDGKLRVLIVEDDEVLRRGLAKMFSPHLFEVVQLGDGDQAVRSVLSAVPDLVLCDYRLPGADGFGVLNCLREKTLSAPFILMTAY